MILIASAHAQFPEIRLNPIYNYDYLELNDISLAYEDYKLPLIKVFTSKDFNGAPLLELSKDGIKIKKNIVCRSASSEDLSSKGISLLQLNSDEQCKENIFPFVTISGSNYGEIQFWIIANHKETDSYYSARLNGKTYYIDKKSLKNFSFKKSVKKLTSEKYKNNYIEIKKYLASNPELSVFIDKVKKCANKKDFECLNIYRINSKFYIIYR